MGTQRQMLDEFRAYINARLPHSAERIQSAAAEIRNAVDYAAEDGEIALQLVILEQSADAEDCNGVQ